MAKKAPRRTAERILDVSLELFNRFGEPNVSTTLISAELSISPGNLYYHYQAKDDLINRLFDRYEKSLNPLLSASGEVKNIAQAWRFFHALLELIWQYRFLYRDLNDLLSKSRRIEVQFQSLMLSKNHAIMTMLKSLNQAGVLNINPSETDSTATSMVVVLSYWLSFEYVRNPRQALEPQNAQLALQRGANQVLNLLHSYIEKNHRSELQELIAA
jgi:AcrR family transcriptional regulator